MRQIYYHLKHNGFLKDGYSPIKETFFISDEEYVQMNHSQRAAIRYQLKGIGAHYKALHLLTLKIINNEN